MTYTPGKPLATDFIDESQPVLKDNFDELDAVFDVDHYKFSDATGAKGKHRTVTTPAESAHPTTSADEPVFYAYEDIAALGVLQYSRGGSNATPTPLTALHGSIASLTTSATDIIDFEGLSTVFGMLWVTRTLAAPGDTGDGWPIIFNGKNTFLLPAGGAMTGWRGTSTGTIQAVMATGSGGNPTKLQLKAFSTTQTNVEWTLALNRVQ